jgi:hypothetical protein
MNVEKIASDIRRMQDMKKVTNYRICKVTGIKDETLKKVQRGEDCLISKYSKIYNFLKEA